MTEFATELSSNGNSANVMLRQDTKSNLHTSQSLEDISVLAKLIFTSYHHKYTAHPSSSSSSGKYDKVFRLKSSCQMYTVFDVPTQLHRVALHAQCAATISLQQVSAKITTIALQLHWVPLH